MSALSLAGVPSGRRFPDRHVMVTGGGTGLGRATALRFAAEGARVSLLGRREAPLLATVELIVEAGGAAVYRTADVGKIDALKGAIAECTGRFGPLDVLVNNAGIAVEAPFLELSEDAWDQVLTTNLKGGFLASQLVAREMAGGGSGGVILHNTSIDAHGGERWHAPYNASKAALEALTRTMAVELAEHGIRVNAVSPGYTLVEHYGDWASPALLAHMKSSFDRVPQRRLIETREVAAAFAFLASDDASGITGHILTVDGGLTANLFVQETWPSS
jgi:NAD(P)-dependent dehydrogenase (short-subunit alcohol dehydrogenase family)